MNRLLARSHQRRDQFRIDNLARCQPPSNWFDERAPYYWSASQHCKAVHLDQTLAEPHKVVVSLGGTPLKHLLGIHKGIRVQDFHGCVTPLPDGKWLVPTFHPSHLQRGAMNLFGAVSFDLQRALQVAEHGWHPTPVDVVVDPPVDWFTWWVEQVAAAVAQEPGSQRVWIAEDIETPDKASGRDEGELTSEDRSFQILRINFSVHPDEGVTVPYAGPYIALCQRLFALNTIHSLWNMEYDNPRLLAAGHTFSGERLDWMWCLAGDSRIPLWGGGERTIRDIVEGRAAVTLIGMDEGGQRIPVTVTAWHATTVAKQEWLAIRTGATRDPIRCTPDHRVWTDHGWKRADALQLGDRIATARLGKNDLIHGTLLGDGHVTRRGDLTWTHGAPQAAWIQAKCRHLGTKAFPRSRGWWAGSVVIGREWRALFHDAAGHKRFVAPPSDAALAVWYCDDGNYHRNHRSHTGGRARIACDAFEPDLHHIQQWFTARFGPNVRFHENGRGRKFMLCLSKETLTAFFTAIAPYVPPSMQYKLSEPYRGQYNGWLERDEVRWASITDIRKVVPHGAPANVRYCVTVDHPTHRFFTVGGLVSNCWHALQSDVPRGLGFVAPFYSDMGAWKHLSDSQPGYYAAVDALQTTRVSFGIATDLEALGMWDMTWRHIHKLHKLALQPAQKVGVKIDRQRLDVFIESLEVKQRRLLHEMQGLVPDAWKPLTPKSGLKKAPADGVLHSKGTELKRDGQAKKEAPDPIKQELYAQTAVVVRRSVRTLATCCEACGAQEVAKTHRCAGTSGVNPARLVPRDLDLLRYFWQEPFNPDSPDQILDFIRHRGHKPGRAKKTGADSTDRETLSRLARETKDPLYQKILDTRAVGKVRGTYGVGTRKLLDAESRVHPVPTFKPSTHRLSYVSPNITNVVADKGGAETLAAGFRACVVASEQDPDWAPQQAPSVHRGTRLFECDFSGIEAVLTGWFQRDPAYMRLARLGVHAGLTSHVVGKPFNPSLPDAEIAAYFSALKAAEPIIYDRCKRNVHGKNYGLTIHGMVKNFPQTFPTLSAAKKISDIYDQMAPGLPVLHTDLRTVAYELNYLGGPSKPLHYPHHLGQIFARNPHLERHPFGYKHWFWSVLGFRGIPYSAYIKRQQQHEPVCIIQGKYFAITLGEDAKRVIAFFPQSTAAAVLKEVMLRLMDPEHPSYVGDAYYGQTPFRAPIHDSLFWEIPVRVWDRVVERIYREMLRPVPELPLDWVSVEDRARYGMGPLLSIGVEGKAGPNWKDMSKVKSPTLQELGLSGDDVVFPVEEADAEDLESLGTVA